MLPNCDIKAPESIECLEESRFAEFKWKAPLVEMSLIWSRLARAMSVSFRQLPFWMSYLLK